MNAFARTEFNYLTWEAQAAKAAREALDRQDYLTAAIAAVNAARHQTALTALREYKSSTTEENGNAKS